MQCPFEANDLSKQFGATAALDHVTVSFRPRSIIGLLGKNGSGKTTLMRHLMGLYLPSGGAATTLGTPIAELDHEQFVRIGYVPQEIRLLDWMTVGQHLEFVASFYPRWDQERQRRLEAELELDLRKQVGSLSTGNLQKVAVILAVCHHPELLVLDEPVSDLDPIARGKLLEFLLELLQEDNATIVVSSHVLRDVEKVVDWVVCLDRGQVVEDAGLDELKERYAEWSVVSRNGDLPGPYPEPYVLDQEVRGRQARLLVDQRHGSARDFRAAHDVELTSRPLNLEEIFPLLLKEHDA
ncbi:MAG: ABC transporter ATP-binding protein [Acidobacteriota bacterium]|jgi:ABC-2 type transport system ATP-binding protein